MIATWKRDENDLMLGGVVFRVTNEVRNEIDPKNVRRLHDAKEVVRTVNQDRSPGGAYMPRKFPRGKWQITAVEWWTPGAWDKDVYGTVRIRTDAHQLVDIWALDVNGGYAEKAGRVLQDYGYLLHYSPSRTTLGCGRIETQKAADKLGRMIEAAMKEGQVWLEVV